MPRHGSLAEQLKALLEYRNRPETVEPVKTNWTTVPANTNADPAEIADYGFERHLRITPSVEEIMRQVDANPPERNDTGQIVRIGKLRFSDGNQTERAYTHGADGKLIQYDAPMPVGAMLGTRDKAETQLGGRGYSNEDLLRSNDHFAELLGTIAPRYVKGTKRRNGKSYTADESRAMLAEAYANTPTLPPVKRYAPGLPCASQRIADCFVGMQKGKKGESGAIAWEDIAMSKVNKEIWDAALAYMTKGDTKTLDAAMSARNTYSIGSDHGYSGRSAWRNGKRALLAATDNLREALKLSAA